jgi:hypothetical protein
MRRALWVVLGAALGCELTHPYPEVFEETGAARCADGVDQDLDGKVDCADEDCAGACAERGQGWCADGLDQDADGRVDLEDPDCWPDAAAEVERCVSTRSTLGALSVDDRAAWVGTGRIAEHADPDGARYAVMLGQRGQHLLSAHVSAGALEGAELALEAWLQPLAVLEVALLPASAAETGPDFPEDHPDALFVTVGLTETWGVEPPWMLVRRGQELPAIAAGLPASRLPARTWTRLSLRIAAGQLEVRLGEASEPSRFQQAGNEVTLRPPASWSESQPLRFAWRAPLEAEVRIRARRVAAGPPPPLRVRRPAARGPGARRRRDALGPAVRAGARRGRAQDPGPAVRGPRVLHRGGRARHAGPRSGGRGAGVA